MDFLLPFVDEAKTLDSFQFEDTPIRVDLRCIICDAPARSSCLGTKGHSGYWGCGRCMQKGDRVNGRTTFPEISAEKRTDQNFRSQANAEHHRVVSPFLQLPHVDVVAQFPLDYLHTLCLGVVKKMLYKWMDEKNMLTKEDITRISDRLIRVSHTQPSDFQRKCRALSDLDFFKGSEFRNLVLYILPIVTHDILPLDIYNHLLTLHTATVILLDSNLCQTHHDVAQELLESFGSLGEIYGPDFIIYNMHSLVHIVDDVKLYGTLDNYSAFAFESFMYKIKKLIRKKNQCLAQLCNRVEEYQAETKYTTPKNNVEFKKKTVLVFPKFDLNSGKRDKWFLTDNDDIYEYRHSCRETNTITARKVETKSAFFQLPISSTNFQIYKSSGVLIPNEVTINVTAVKAKLFAMPLDDKIVFAPLRHTEQ